MKQVLNETLRCSILAPFAARVQDVDIELGGHKIAAGVSILILIFNLILIKIVAGVSI